MSFVLERSQTEIKRTTVTVTIPENNVAHLMYYLSCVCTVIDCNDDAQIQRFTSYQNWNHLTIDDQKVLVFLCFTFSPDVFNDKVFFQKDSLCVHHENEFYEINQQNHVLVGSESVLIAGRLRRVTKFMTYKLSWLQKYYIGPMGRLTERLNSPLRHSTRQPIEYRPSTTTNSAPTYNSYSAPVKSRKRTLFVWITVFCVIFFILPSIIGGIWTSIINPITYSQSSVEKLLNQGGYVMMSAGRNNKMPSDQNLSDETIRERNVNLTIDLTNTYAYSSMFGFYNGDNETSFFVILHNISPDTERNVFIELGQKYNQESIIYVKRATPTIQQFIYTTGEFSGKYVEGQGYKVLSTNITDDYSELNVCPDDIFKFTLNFNFEIMIMGNTRIKTRQLIDHHTNYIRANRKRQTF
ncbi:unnamed protein product [Rotaria socialis]|uniref:Uncharacterized protein n=1 Tax=Rotaria socialis TaxID=392032 RepID=A0A821TNE4_9BILA|nr:unnamed protein product [Rotaria socialis]